MMPAVRGFETAAGRRIYALTIQVFSQLAANVYVISDGKKRILVDSGSGQEESNRQLVAALARIGEELGEEIRLRDIDAILITHGHIDHFGGLGFLRQHTDAPIGVHPLDRRVLSHYEERLIVVSKQLGLFLKRAGVSEPHHAKLMQLYLSTKNLFQSVPVSFSLDEGSSSVDGISVYHVPGHCPGQVCLLIDDVLLTADHVLSHITPHQAPEAITHNTGLGHYLDSLERIARIDGVSLGLGGHQKPMEDVAGRIREIQRLHRTRLDQVLEICREPASVVDVSRRLFGQVNSYHVLLALMEAGAHVEFLYQRGELVASNLQEIERNPNPVIRYVRT